MSDLNHSPDVASPPHLQGTVSQTLAFALNPQHMQPVLRSRIPYSGTIKKLRAPNRQAKYTRPKDSLTCVEPWWPLDQRKRAGNRPTQDFPYRNGSEHPRAVLDDLLLEEMGLQLSGECPLNGSLARLIGRSSMVVSAAPSWTRDRL